MGGSQSRATGGRSGEPTLRPLEWWLWGSGLASQWGKLGAREHVAQAPAVTPLCHLQLTMNDFSVHRIIGRGGFGEVYGCRKADTGKM